MTKEPRKRCRASVWPQSGWRDHQCTKAASTTRDIRGQHDHVENLPVCGTHARVIDRSPWRVSAYFWGGSVYETKVAEFIREYPR